MHDNDEVARRDRREHGQNYGESRPSRNHQAYQRAHHHAETGRDQSHRRGATCRRRGTDTGRRVVMVVPSSAVNCRTPGRRWTRSRSATAAVTKRSPSTPAAASLAFLEARHRAHARVEDRIRTGKDTGLGHLPSRHQNVNEVWVEFAPIAADLLAQAQSMPLTYQPELHRAEPKTLRTRLLHTAAPITRGQRKVFLLLAEHWPWARALAKAFTRLRADPTPDLTATQVPLTGLVLVLELTGNTEPLIVRQVLARPSQPCSPGMSTGTRSPTPGCNGLTSRPSLSTPSTADTLRRWIVAEVPDLQKQLVSTRESGADPPSESHYVADSVGFGFAAVASIFTFRLPPRWRPDWVAALVGLALAALLVSRTFTDVGHILALGLGFAAYPLTTRASVRSRITDPLLFSVGRFPLQRRQR